MATELGQAYVQIMPSAKGISGSIQKTINPEATAAGKSAGSNIASSISKKMGSLGSTLTKAITVPVAGAATAAAGLVGALGFNRLVGLDTAQAKLKGLGYSGKEVERISKQVETAIEGGMTTMGEGVDVAAGALAAGVKEGAELEKYISLVGDAAVGANRPVDEMAQIFNRVQGGGRLMTQELNMIEQGLPGFAQAMADEVAGGSLDTFRQMVTNGEVGSDEFLNVMDGFAGGMADAYSESWAGMAKNTLAYVGIIGEALLEGLFEDGKEGLADFIEVLKSDEVMDWAKETGEKIRDVASKIVEVAKKVIDWWTNLSSGGKKITGIFGAIAVAIGPILLVVSKIVSTFMTLLPLFKLIGAAISALVGAISLPVALIVAAIVAAAALIYVYWEPIKDFFIKLWESIKEISLAIWEPIKEVWKSVVEFILDLWEPVAEFFTELWTDVSEFFAEVWEEIKEIALMAWEPIQEMWRTVVDMFMLLWEPLKEWFLVYWENIKTVISTVWEVISTIISTAIDIISNIISTNFEIIKTVIKTVWEVIKTIITTVWTVIKTIIQSALGILKALVSGDFNEIKKAMKNAMESAKSIINTILGAIKSIFTTILNGIKSVASSAFNGMKSVISSIMNGIKSTISSVWNGIKSVITNTVNGIKSVVSNIFNSLSGIVSGAISGVRSALSSGMSGALSVVTGMAGRFLSAGRNIVTSIASGITGAIGKVTSAISNVASKVRDFLPFSPPKAGPLMDIMDVKWGETIGGGIEKGEGTIAKAMDNVLDFDLSKEANFNNTASSNPGNSDNRTINISVDASNIDELKRVIDIFTGLKQGVRQG